MKKNKPRLVIEHTDEKMMQRFKIKCLKVGMSMTQKIIEWIKKFLKNEIE